jgi:hypothetical protein
MTARLRDGADWLLRVVAAWMTHADEIPGAVSFVVRRIEWAGARGQTARI